MILRKTNKMLLLTQWLLLIFALAWTHLLPTCDAQFDFRTDDPGVVVPETSDLEIGSNLDIYCRMNPLIFKNSKASDLYFLEGSNKRNVSAKQIEILDSTTIVMHLKNLSEQITNYVCYCGIYAIRESKVFVGTRPRPVEDFQCRSYDYEYMLCHYSKPYNPIFTSTNISFYTHSASYKYYPSCIFEPNNLVHCNITQTEMYRPTIKDYYFNITSSNTLDSLVQKIHINNLDVMIPIAPGSHNNTDDIVEIYTNAVKLSWQMPNWECPNLKWNITVQAQNFEHSITNFKHNCSLQQKFCSSKNCKKYISITVDKLPYANWNYTIMIKVKKSKSTIPNLWSEPLIYKFKTKPMKPMKAPITTNGGFYINSTETQVRLYWEQLAPHEENGDNFSYSIEEIYKNGQIM